ncbi:SDR family oxidoreductase [Pendulispora brunnea]|uniref:SDR family oxidoreductase n=1 Tax=Pendulispora brunnea TaxID=2905690 RepID=A0ABZ2JZY4_9BACT
MTCLVTGATGNVGSLVTQRLIDRGDRPCVFVRDPKKARDLFGDRVEIRVGDLADISSALSGIREIFLLNSGPDLEVRDRAAALAAKAAGVRHLVKLSTLDVSTGVGTGPWHARGEHALRESGVRFTFIRSSAFMSNALSWAHTIKREGVLRTSTGNGKIAFIHPADIADVAVKALTTRAHDGEALVITGPQALSYGEMASRIGAAIGKTIRFEQISDDDARPNFDRAYADALVDIWRAIREGRLATVTDGVEQVLGRRPVTFDQWAEENAGAFRRSGTTRGKRGRSARPPPSLTRPK